MKLFWGAHTCAIGIHILLEEIGLPYETEKVDVKAGDTRRPPFSHINPKGKVPVLMRDDNTILTEYGAIATWLARTNPQKNLIPVDAEGEARGAEIMEYVCGTLHGQGYGRMFKPELFEPANLINGTLGIGKDNVRDHGRKMVETAFEILDGEIAGKIYATGNSFTIADTALFYAERWAPANKIRLPRNVLAHFERMLSRPSVQKVTRHWGEYDQLRLSKAA